jgi:hypothetical protein
MVLSSLITDGLNAHPGNPQSVAEIAAAIPGSRWEDILYRCEELRADGKVGRNGANTAISPLRFYMKRRVAGIETPPSASERRARN